MRFHPQRWAKVYDHWLTNIQDWCISRQLWWGHRIPVWRKVADVPRPSYGFPSEVGPEECSFSGIKGEVSYVSQRIVGENKGVLKIENQIVTASEAEAKKLEELGWYQDPDVLDTWASSWLWPFATMGWTGDKSQDSKNPTLQAFYPTTDLVTAPEIIFFWVARMIMAGFEYMGEMPFRNVYFTGIIRDKIGRKMSKSLGNSPDPLDLIAKYGADAVRFGTMRSAPLGQDVMFDEKDVELGRNFCNKLWNACRFRQMQDERAVGILPADQSSSASEIFRQDAGSTVEGEIDPRLLTNDDKWILLKLDQAIREIDAAFAEYKFNEATQTLYRFFWSEYCDWYVEASKAVLGRATDAGIPSPLNGERARVRGEEQSDVSHDAASPPHPDPLPPAARGGEGTPIERSTISADVSIAHRANTLAVIDFVLSHTLRLFHPFLPFITEELWHGLGYQHDLPADQGGDTIMFAHWPKPFDADFKEHYGLDDCYLDFVDAKFELVTLGRNLRRENNIASNKKLSSS
jgi:valyl-tRNA synthetase